MPTQIINADGSQYGWNINKSGAGLVQIQNFSGIEMNVDITGYPANQIIRKECGSPAVWYIFNSISNTLMIDNSIGSSPIYFNFDSIANPVSSGTGYLQNGGTLFFDAQIGSISIQGSGITTPMVQIIKLS